MRRFLSVLALMSVPLLAPVSAQADGGGIKFDQVPKGSAFYYKSIGDGITWVEYYGGVENGLHVMRKYFLQGGKVKPEPFQIAYFDPAGRLVRLDKLLFKSRHSWEPFACWSSNAAQCSHLHTVVETATGKVSARHKNSFEIKSKRNGRTVVRHPSGNRVTTYYKLDDRNLILESKPAKPVLDKGYRLMKQGVPQQ